MSEARQGHEIDGSSRSDLELGSVYTDNPMHGDRQMEYVVNSSVHTSDESLLLLKEKVERKFEEQQSQITEQQSQITEQQSQIAVQQGQFEDQQSQITMQQSQIEKLLKNNEEFEKKREYR